VIDDLKPEVPRDLDLKFLDPLVVELIDAAAPGADDVVVVIPSERPLVDASSLLEERLAQDAAALEESQGAVDRCTADAAASAPEVCDHLLRVEVARNPESGMQEGEPFRREPQLSTAEILPQTVGGLLDDLRPTGHGERLQGMLIETQFHRTGEPTRTWAWGSSRPFRREVGLLLYAPEEVAGRRKSSVARRRTTDREDQMSRKRPLYDVLGSLRTEEDLPATRNLDLLDEEQLVRKIHREDLQAWRAVGAAQTEIAAAARLAVTALAVGGRILYVGAGTSGRLGVLDAAECPPTFGVPTTRVRGLIAGGAKALRRSVEGAEDRFDEGRRGIARLRAGADDLVIGIAASRRTPYVLGALQEARRRGSRTVLIHCNPAGPEEKGCDVVIRLPVGAEVLTGSTRMKSGTAQKMTLNLISTTAWVRQGKTFGNLMVDLLARSEKLQVRGLRILVSTTDLEPVEAQKLLKLAGGHVKLAIYMARTGADARTGRSALRRWAGSLRRALEEAGADSDPYRPAKAASLRQKSGGASVRPGRPTRR
jgi:N-acetylmuramic acid 6-phosphate etherase